MSVTAGPDDRIQSESLDLPGRIGRAIAGCRIPDRGRASVLSLARAVVTVAVRLGHNSLRCEGAFPGPDPVPVDGPAHRAVAVLGSACLRGHAPHRRPAVAHLLACVPPSLLRGGSNVSAARHLCPDPAGPRGAVDFEVVPGSRLAPGRRPRRGHGLCLRRFRRMAHPAYRSDPKLCLFRGRPMASASRLKQGLGRLGGSGRSRRRPDAGRAEPGGPPRRLCPGELPHRSLVDPAGSPARRARQRSSCRMGDRSRPWRGRCAVGHVLPLRRVLQPPRCCLCGSSARLTQSCVAYHDADRRPVWRLRPQDRLLGAIQRLLGCQRSVALSEHGANVHRRAADAADPDRRPRARCFVGPRGACLCGRDRFPPAVWVGKLHAGISGVLRGAAGRGTVPAARRRLIPSRRHAGDRRWLSRAPLGDRRAASGKRAAAAGRDRSHWSHSAHWAGDCR